MNQINPQDGKPCGEKVQVGRRNMACKFHFGVEHFTSIAQMKEVVKPDPRDYRYVPAISKPHTTHYSILKYSLEGSPARGEYPADDPAFFEREPRIHPPTGMQHYGWCPVWSNGLRWSYWGYQHGFGGDYYNRVLKAALRFEISDQIEDARYGMGDAMHVHHAGKNTFAVLSSAWMGINSLFARDVAVCEPQLGYKALLDRELAASWQEFHAEHASLEVLTPEEHRAIHSAVEGGA